MWVLKLRYQSTVAEIERKANEPLWSTEPCVVCGERFFTTVRRTHTRLCSKTFHNISSPYRDATFTPYIGDSK